MLESIPRGVSKATRIVVLNHPNRMECICYGKVVTRSERTGAEAPDDMVGGLPTLGGAAVLEPEEETEFELDLKGEGFALFVGQYQGGKINDARTVMVPDGSREVLIESIGLGEWAPSKGDIIMCMPGAGVVLSYEVVGTTGQIDIPPYSWRYVVAPRDDLRYIPEFQG